MSVSPVMSVDQVREHLCSKGLYGDVTEWCETRHDCVYVVTCPDCSEEFILDDIEYDALLTWSRSSEQACGVDFPHA